MASSKEDDLKSGDNKVQAAVLPNKDASAVEKGGARPERAAEPSVSAPPKRGKKYDPYSAIGRGLKRMFDDVVSEPIPDDLMELVKKLESGDDSAEGGS